MRGLSRQLKTYVGVVTALGLAALAVSFVARPLQPTLVTISLAGALCALTGLAGVYPLPFSAKIKANVATAPIFGAVLLLSPAFATLVAAVGVAGSELAQKRKAHNVIFNTAAAAIYTCGSALVFAAVRSDAGFFSWPHGAVAALLAASVIYAGNRILIAEAASLQLKTSPIKLWLPSWKQDLVQELSLFALGFAGAIAINAVTWAIIPLCLPVVIVYKSMSRVTSMSARLEAQMAELRATQAQLVQAAKMASLGTLTAGLGHQINNPIFVIRGRSELLLESADRNLKNDKARQHLEVIHGMADRVARIVRCMLTSTRPTEDGNACTDVNSALDTMVDLLDSKISKARVRVIKDYAPGLPLVPGDAIEIQEILGNLISNACDAMPNGGDLLLRTMAEGQAVTICVADSGAGISPENINRIFDPFFTTKESSGGIGLGLYVVKNGVEKHGGKVKVESYPGRGTTFNVSLPAAESWAPAVSYHTSGSQPRQAVIV